MNKEQSTEQDNDANKRHRDVGLENKTSNVTFARRNDKTAKSRSDIQTSTQEHGRELPVDNLQVSRNRTIVLRSNESLAGTQTRPSPRPVSTVDEAVAAKPSKIHKLKKSAASPSGRQEEMRPKTSEENSEKSTRSGEPRRANAVKNNRMKFNLLVLEVIKRNPAFNCSRRIAMTD